MTSQHDPALLIDFGDDFRLRGFGDLGGLRRRDLPLFMALSTPRFETFMSFAASSVRDSPVRQICGTGTLLEELAALPCPRDLAPDRWALVSDRVPVTKARHAYKAHMDTVEAHALWAMVAIKSLPIATFNAAAETIEAAARAEDKLAKADYNLIRLFSGMEPVWPFQ
jgi:hypothetical protein